MTLLPTGVDDFPSDEYSKTPRNPLSPGIKTPESRQIINFIILFVIVWKYFSLHHVQIGSGVHSASYKMIARDFLGIKTAS